MTERSELAETPNATAERALDVLYNPDLDFRRLALDTAYVSQGFRLVEKLHLEAVPHVIKRIIFRDGFPRGEKGEPGDYVTVEAVVASRDILDSAPVKAMIAARDQGPELGVFPNEPVVYNDSGTGIRRELVNLCAKENLISFAATRQDEVPADLPYQRWATGADQAATGFTGQDFGGREAIYLALRGLRQSVYDFMPGVPAVTWYFG